MHALLVWRTRITRIVSSLRHDDPHVHVAPRVCCTAQACSAGTELVAEVLLMVGPQAVRAITLDLGVASMV